MFVENEKKESIKLKVKGVIISGFPFLYEQKKDTALPCTHVDRLDEMCSECV